MANPSPSIFHFIRHGFFRVIASLPSPSHLTSCLLGKAKLKMLFRSMWPHHRNLCPAVAAASTAIIVPPAALKETTY